jgi:hypothetical protein
MLWNKLHQTMHHQHTPKNLTVSFRLFLDSVQLSPISRLNPGQEVHRQCNLFCKMNHLDRMDTLITGMQLKNEYMICRNMAFRSIPRLKRKKRKKTNLNLLKADLIGK